MYIPASDTLETVRAMHSFLEWWAIGFFVGVVVCDVFLHFTEHADALAWTLGWSARRLPLKLFSVMIPAYRGRLSLRAIVKLLSLTGFAVAIAMEAIALPYSERIDVLSEKDVLDSQKQTVTALRQAGEANRDAAAAQSMARGFEAQIAELEKQTAEAKSELSRQQEQTGKVELALEKERAKRLPRRVTPEQTKALIAELKGRVDKLFLVGRDEQEPLQFADQFITALRAADLLDTYVLTNAPSQHWSGIVLYIPLPATATNEEAENDPLVKAFRHANIQINSVRWGTVSGLVTDSRLNRRQRTIYIGERPLEQ